MSRAPAARCLRTDRKQSTKSSASCRWSNELAAMNTRSNVRPRWNWRMSPCTHSTCTPPVVRLALSLGKHVGEAPGPRTDARRTRSDQTCVRCRTRVPDTPAMPIGLAL
jgi:hypothetical protein